ncbi:hypothetical protein D3C78_1631370 [compost metagenome]
MGFKAWERLSVAANRLKLANAMYTPNAEWLRTSVGKCWCSTARKPLTPDTARGIAPSMNAFLRPIRLISLETG